jgi:hypothetical protein
VALPPLELGKLGLGKIRGTCSMGRIAPKVDSESGQVLWARGIPFKTGFATKFSFNLLHGCNPCTLHSIL